MVLRLAPGHLGALKGMGFVCFQQGRFAQAEEYLAAARSARRRRRCQVASALAHVRDARREMARAARAIRAGCPRARRTIRASSSPTCSSEAEQTALLLDRDGLVLAGAYVAWDGRDVGQEVGAELSGVTDAARRATRDLALGEWTSIVFETEVAVVAMTPSTNDGLLVLATSRATPLGLVRRLLDRCAERARRWQGGRL